MKDLIIKFSEDMNPRGIHTFVFRDARTGEIIRRNTYKNLIVNVGKNMIANRLTGTGNDCDITHGAVGTNAAAPAVGDTALGTEIDRVAVSSMNASGAVVTAICFFGAADGNGVLTEYGLFCESGATMLVHVAISETKTSAETLTVESSITIA